MHDSFRFYDDHKNSAERGVTCVSYNTRNNSYEIYYIYDRKIYFQMLF